MGVKGGSVLAATKSWSGSSRPDGAVAHPPYGRGLLPCGLAAALIATWVLLSAALHPGQWGDNMEQFVWAHSLEWGYYKHPPLPTWLMGAAIALFGPSPWWAYALAGLCTAATGFFTYGIARPLLGPRLAWAALLLWGLQQAFSIRAALYNHNTVLMLATSACAWCVLRALDGRRMGWWLAAGMAAAAALLCKYQALVPLGGLLVALAWGGDLRRAEVRRGLALAVAAAVLLVLPHLLWLVQNDFPTLHYASQEGRGRLDALGRAKSVVGFLAQQLRLLLPALLLALWWWLQGRRALAGPQAPAAARRHAWFIGLIAFPLLVTLLTGPLLGLRLQNHWGFQCLQFVGLWLAWRLRRVVPPALPRLVGPVLALHALSLLLTLSPLALRSQDVSKREDHAFPAALLARAVLQDWQQATRCPLQVVVGPSFEAGIVSVYGDGRPAVLENGDFRMSPWIRPEHIEQHGAVYVSYDAAALPSRAARLNALPLGTLAPRAGVSADLHWAVVPPRHCADD